MGFEPTDLIPPFPPRADANGVEPAFARTEPLITAGELKRQFLFGIPLKSTITREELKDPDITAIITRAVSRVEHEAKIWISPVKFVDRFDYNVADWKQWSFIQLNHWPVLQIESFRVQYPFQNNLIEYPTDWLQIQNQSGILQLVPTSGTMSQVFYTQGGNFLPLLLGSTSKLPQAFEVVYTAGFENDKIPGIVNTLIGTYAAIEILTLVNSVIFLGSYSIGIDGASQGVSLPGPGFLDARLRDLNEKADKLLKSIQHFYNHAVLISSL